MNKKAQIGQIAFIIVLLFTIVVASLIGKTVLNEVENSLDDSGLQTTESKKVFSDFAVAWPTFDYMILFIMIGLTIALVITSFLIPSHPVFIIINIVGMFGLVFLSATISNMYYEMVAADGENPVFNSIVDDGRNDFAKMTFIMKYLPWICLIITFISTVVMFSKGKAEGFG